jgi:hypothetical protein
MTDRRALAEHLKFFQELGVTGVSRDPSGANAQTMRRPRTTC